MLTMRVRSAFYRFYLYGLMTSMIPCLREESQEEAYIVAADTAYRDLKTRPRSRKKVGPASNSLCRLSPAPSVWSVTAE